MVTGPSVIAPPLRRPVLVGQFWSDLTFVHWPVRPAAVAHLFPDGTRPDVFGHALTYVGLIPFVMRHTALADRVPVVFGTLLVLSVPLLAWLAVFGPF